MSDSMSDADSFQDVLDETNSSKVDWPASDVESVATETSSWLVVEAEDSEVEGWEKEDPPGAPGEKIDAVCNTSGTSGEPALFYSACEKSQTSAAADSKQEVGDEDSEADTAVARNPQLLSCSFKVTAPSPSHQEMLNEMMETDTVVDRNPLPLLCSFKVMPPAPSSQKMMKEMMETDTEESSESDAEEMDDLVEGDKVLRKGEEAVVMKIDRTLDPPSFTVLMLKDGREVGTERAYLEKVHELEEEEQTRPTLAEEKVDQLEPAEQVFRMASGKLLAAQPLALGSDRLLECSGASGDVTAMWSAAFECSPGVSGAYCLGRIFVAASGSPAECEALPVGASVVVLNDGEIEWSAGTALRLVAGDAHGFDMMPAGPLPAGHAAELRLDLHVPTDGKEMAGDCGRRSAWVLTDECGTPFGPLLVLEVVWM